MNPQGWTPADGKWVTTEPWNQDAQESPFPSLWSQVPSITGQCHMLSMPLLNRAQSFRTYGENKTENELTSIIKQQMTSCTWDAPEPWEHWHWTITNLSTAIWTHQYQGQEEQGRGGTPNKSAWKVKPESSPPPTLTEQIFVNQS